VLDRYDVAAALVRSKDHTCPEPLSLGLPKLRPQAPAAHVDLGPDRRLAKLHGELECVGFELLAPHGDQDAVVNGGLFVILDEGMA